MTVPAPAPLPAPEWEFNQVQAVAPPDPLVGFWVWAEHHQDPALRAVLQGQLVARVDEFYLIRYCDADVLAEGAHELVALHRIHAEKWTLFPEETHLRAAVKARQANDEE